MAASAFMAASGLAVILIVTDAPGFNNKKRIAKNRPNTNTSNLFKNNCRMVFSKIWSPAAMQKIMLAMPRRFREGFHYTGEKKRTSREKLTMQVASEEIAKAKILVQVCSSQVLLAGQNPCWWLTATSKITSILHSTKPKGRFF